MPSRVVTATNVAPVGVPPGALVSAAVRNAKHKVTSLAIDNTVGIANHLIQVVDSFTPDASNLVAVPVFTTVVRYQRNVLMGDALVLEEEDLKGVECLGNLSILAEAVDGACSITVGWDSP